MTIKGMIDDLLKRGWIVEYLAYNSVISAYCLHISHMSYNMNDIELKASSLKDAVTTAYKQVVEASPKETT